MQAQLRFRVNKILYIWIYSFSKKIFKGGIFVDEDDDIGRKVLDRRIRHS